MKTGKITVFATDYTAVAHVAKLLNMQLIEQTQIGVEINIVVKYKDLTQVGKLYENVALLRGKSITPPTGSADKKQPKK